jgi:hypothetical protein
VQTVKQQERGSREKTGGSQKRPCETADRSIS